MAESVWRILRCSRLPPQNGQSFDLLSPPDSSELAMEVLFRSGWFSLSVIIRFVVELFRKHMVDSWLSYRL
jgi:hypothetical protein